MNHVEITKTKIYYKKLLGKTFLYNPIKDIWPYLRKPCTIDSGVTWEDLLKIILTNDSLKYFVEKCYPHYLFIPPSDVISRNVNIKNNVLKINPISYPYSKVDKPLILKNKTKIKNNDKTPLPASMKWNLLEILDILFSDAKSKYFCSLSYAGLRDEENNLISQDDEMACLMSRCNIYTNTTLGDIFRFVSNNKILEDFISKFSVCDVSAFHDAARIKPEKLSTEIKHLQISSHGELICKKFYILSRFYGVTGNITKKAEIPPAEQHSVTMTPMRELIHLPIILNHKFIIRFSKNSKVFVDCLKEFTLLDVLDAIYWDIGSYGWQKEPVSYVHNNL